MGWVVYIYKMSKLRKKTLEQQFRMHLKYRKNGQTTEFASTDFEKFKKYLRKNGQEILAADKNVG